MRRPGLRRVATLALSALALAVAVPVGQAVAAEDPYGPFRDDHGSVHELDIIALWAAGITKGCDSAGHEFCPDDPVSRGQMAAFLVRAMGLSPEKGDVFTDVAGSTFEDDIVALAGAGITNGCGDGRYCPDAPVTREQMAAFLVRALELSESGESGFVDVADSPFRAEIDALWSAGITKGCTEARYCPGERVTRGQMASFLVRAFGIPRVDPPPCPEEVCGLTALIPDDPSHGEDWRPLVQALFPASEVDRAVRVLHCESQGDPEARNSWSGASGLFQHLPKYWDDRAAKAGYRGASIWDPIANVGVAAWLVEVDGWHHWWQCL